MPLPWFEQHILCLWQMLLASKQKVFDFKDLGLSRIGILSVAGERKQTGGAVYTERGVVTAQLDLCRWIGQ